MRIRQFSKHSIVYKEGESDDAIYILVSGIARLICLNRKGKRNLLEVLGPGDVIRDSVIVARYSSQTLL